MCHSERNFIIKIIVLRGIGGAVRQRLAWLRGLVLRWTLVARGLLVTTIVSRWLHVALLPVGLET